MVVWRDLYVINQYPSLSDWNESLLSHSLEKPSYHCIIISYLLQLKFPTPAYNFLLVSFSTVMSSAFFFHPSTGEMVLQTLASLFFFFFFFFLRSIYLYIYRSIHISVYHSSAHPVLSVQVYGRFRFRFRLLYYLINRKNLFVILP